MRFLDTLLATVLLVLVVVIVAKVRLEMLVATVPYSTVRYGNPNQ